MLTAHLRARGIHRRLSSCRIHPHHAAIERPEQTQSLANKVMSSPAAIASLIHQHIAFGTRPWEVGNRTKERTTLNTSRRDSASRDIAPLPGLVKTLGGRNTSKGPLVRRPLRIPTSTAADLEVLAKDLEAYAATTSSTDALPRIYHRQGLRPRLLAILAHTQDAACAWAAYRSLLILPRSPDKPAPKIPFPHRHRLLRLLAAAPPRPRARGRFAQVLAVLRALHDAGGIVKLWEWNLLLDCAGKEGWRRPREEHFRAALALLAEMRRVTGDTGGGAGTTVVSPMNGGRGGGNGGGGGADGDGDGAARSLEPDIFSYTTLLAHAVRTRSPAAVRHAAQLLARAGLAPGVHAHTALLCFFAQRGDLAGVRDTLFRLRRRNVPVQQDGSAGTTDVGLGQVPFNVVLWAFAYNGRLDVARAMYRVVRARVTGVRRPTVEEEEEEEEQEEEEELVAELESALAEREMIVIAPEVLPDAATYHILIQAHAYHGDLRGCLETLADMLSAPVPSSRSLRSDERQQGQQGQFTASLAAFRAIFLGFTRHGVGVVVVEQQQRSLPLSPSPSSSPDPSTTTSTLVSPLLPSQKQEQRQQQQGTRGGESEWTLATLEALFARFLELPRDAPLRETTLFWLVSAFARTSGHDAVVLRRVFVRVEDRFALASKLTCGGSGVGSSSSSSSSGGRGGGRLARIRERVFLAAA